MKTSEFPILEISKLAEKESWRKEVNRPIYHLHKWWAQRLGSVFRAILIYLLKPEDKNTWNMFYEDNQFDKIVFDPFMGSGTTLGEALKIGTRVIGCDINPISSFLVKQELADVPVFDLKNQMKKLEETIAPKIRKYYVTHDPKTNQNIPVLYYFWVKFVVTPNGEKIPLFANYIFAKNAYPSKKPTAQIICPKCWDIFTERYDSIDVKCPHCDYRFNPQDGSAKGTFVYDIKGEKYKIKSLLKKGERLEEKMYALLALNKNGDKEYLCASENDIALYEEAANQLKIEDLPIPQMKVRSGYNTDQAKGYNYLAWADFFNSRQLLCLGLLLKEITLINDVKIREQFLCLFSSTLEFNNMFCSYKGEGTGAVRPIFSNHILKPERTPLENSVWGTEKSSGCFSTLFKTRFLAAKSYLENPFEIKIGTGKEQCYKVPNSRSMSPNIVSNWEMLASTKNSALILCGDSANVQLPSDSIDLVVTDPPYFDYINYSELSDFFYAWLSPILRERYSEFKEETSGRINEVQQSSPEEFSRLLSNVFQECYRVMKKDAKLCFSFHHARTEGWVAIIEALIHADLYIEEAFPVHAELMASTPKAGTKEPISLDIILVCTKQRRFSENVSQISSKYINMLQSIEKKLSKSDVFVVYAAQTLVNCVNLRLSRIEILHRLEMDFLNVDSYYAQINKCEFNLNSTQNSLDKAIFVEQLSLF